MAMTGNGDNDTHVPSQSGRAAQFEREPSQAMRASGRDPAGGEIPVELAATSRLMTSLSRSGCRGQIGLSYSYGQRRQNNLNSVLPPNPYIGVASPKFVGEVNL